MTDNPPLTTIAPRGPIDAAAKLACATREVGMRKNVYPNYVRRFKMSEANARMEIATMQAIADDYAAERSPLAAARIAHAAGVLKMISEIAASFPIEPMDALQQIARLAGEAHERMITP